MEKADYFKQEITKFINKEVTGSKFVNKDLDKYIYASLSQPPITVECPNCHCAVRYDFIRDEIINNNPVKSNKVLMKYIANHNKEKRIDYILNHRINRISTLNDFIDDMFYLYGDENISTTIK